MSYQDVQDTDFPLLYLDHNLAVFYDRSLGIFRVRQDKGKPQELWLTQDDILKIKKFIDIVSERGWDF